MVSAPLKRVSSLHRTSRPINYVDGDPSMVQTTKDIKGAATSRLGYHALKNSLDSGYRYRGATMGVVNEEGRTKAEPEPVPRPGTKMSSSVRSKKHGSFDFEKTGWDAPLLQRSGSNRTTTSEWSKDADSIHKERDSTYGPGLAGVGTLQRDLSVRRGQEREEKMRLRDLTRKQTLPADKDHIKTKPHSSSTHSDHLHASTSTTGKSNAGTQKSTPNTGRSSSMSKASGKRAVHGNKPISRTGVARYIGLTTQHGPFSFEPAVPSSTRSAESDRISHEVQVSWSKSEKERARLRDEKEREQSKDKKNVQRGDRPPVPVPMPSTNAGHRSGTKGRSLDLGLGLAWAPSKVREEALLPSSTFFARTLSNSSSTRSRSGSTATGASSTVGNGSGRSKRGMMNQDPDVQRSQLGKEVAELFKHAVDPQGYAAFRKCELLFCFFLSLSLDVLFLKTCTNSMRMKYHLMDLRGSLRGSNDFWILLLDLELKQNNVYWINLPGSSFKRHSQPAIAPHFYITQHLNDLLTLGLFKISTIYLWRLCFRVFKLYIYQHQLTAPFIFFEGLILSWIHIDFHSYY